ncbi:MAG: hypothetical protein LBN39_03660, partial [Planctomycetaceae bacterium]|nr:hypothetical protein [Planctomycetaceae bacterium]
MSAINIPVSTPPVQPKTRSERVALKSSPQGLFSRVFGDMKRNNAGTFFLFICCTAIAVGVIVRAWDPPFEFRANNVIDRAIVCNTAFSMPSPEGKRLAADRARANAMHIFANDQSITVQIRESLWNKIAEFANANSYDELDAAGKDAWNMFLRPGGKGDIPPDVDPKAAFQTFRTFFKDDITLDLLNKRLRQAFTPFELHGTLQALKFGAAQGNQEQILVYQKGKMPDSAVPFKVSEVLIRDGSRIKEALQRELNNPVLVEQLFNWIYPKWNDETLTEDQSATADAQKKAENSVGEVRAEYVPGQILVEDDEVLNPPRIFLLKAEYKAFLAKRLKSDQVLRFHSVILIIITLFTVSWGFVQRMERRRPKTVRAFAGFAFGIVLTVAVAEFFRGFPLTGAEWEILPLLLFTMTVSIIYSWELAVIYSVLLSIILAFTSSGGGDNLLILLLGTSVTTAIQLGR